MTIKQIEINQLRPGMFVVKLDMAWFLTPFYLRQRIISSVADVERLKRAGVKNLTIDIGRGTDVIDPLSELRNARAKLPVPELIRDVKAEFVAAMRDVTKSVASERPLVVKELQSPLDSLSQLVAEHLDAVIMQIHLRRKVQTWGIHAHACTALSLALNQSSQLSADDLKTVCYAAMLHDVGWVRLPTALYAKRQTYSNSEKSLVYKHPQQSVAVLAKADGLPQPVLDIVLQHHERQDGSGFPFGLSARELNALTQRVALVSAYDERVHGLADAPPQLPALVLAALRNEAAAGIWSLELLDQLEHVIGRYPVTSAVMLETGEVGIVVAQNHGDVLRPCVKIVYDRRMRRIASPEVIDLRNDSSRRIVKPIDPTAAQADPDRLLLPAEV